MRHFARGQSIVFTHTFYDSSGDVTSPTSAALTIAYPSSGYPFRTTMETTTLTMTQDTTTLSWSATWSSTGAYPGPCYSHIRANDLTLSVKDDVFALRANPANLSLTT